MSGNEIFYKFLPDLRSQNPQARFRTARELRNYIESESRDLSHNVYLNCVTELSSKLMELCNGNEVIDRLAGIVAMDELVDLFIAERNDQIIIEYAHSMCKIFEKVPGADVTTLRTTSRALGHIVSTGGTSLIEFVEEYHMKPALVWLENESFHVRRQAGVMILKELAINSPSIFYRHVDKYFDVIWSGFWDSKHAVRQSSADSLQACFSLIHQRESNRKNLWYGRTLDEVERGFAKGNADAAHGALLIVNELLRNTGDFMYQYYTRVYRMILQFRDHKNTAVRIAVINLFPRLAKFNSSAFQEHCYATCMTHLLEVLHSASSSTRGDALLSVGKLALAIGHPLARDDRTLPGILSGIKIGLRESRKREFDSHKEALSCLRMLVEAVGPALLRFDFDGILLLLFQHELNHPLVDTLTAITKRIPSQKSVVQLRLFERLSNLLLSTRQIDSMGQPPTSMSLARTRSKTSISMASGNLLSIFSSAIQSKGLPADGSTMSSALPGDASSTIAIQNLALETLADFDFQGNRHIPVLQFVHETVVKFLDHDAPQIRRSAALTCCKLLLPSGREAPVTGELARPISAVVERLLMVGIADSNAEIRSRVLASLDARFDPLLGQSDNLRCLFIALNDEIFEIRETAMSTLGRLTHKNPSLVMPSLRQTLVQLLAELEYSGDSKGKEEGALLIGCLLRSSGHLAKPYVLPILKALMQNLREDSAVRSRSTMTVSKAILATLGDLSSVGGEQLVRFLDQLLPEIIEEIREASNPQILQVAIRTLGQLVSSTGYVIRPYHEFPDLLDLLCQALQKTGDSNVELRIEAGRTLGMIGALDPYNLRLLHLQKQGSNANPAITKELQRLQARESHALTTSTNATNTTNNNTLDVFGASTASSTVSSKAKTKPTFISSQLGLFQWDRMDEDSNGEIPLLVPRPMSTVQNVKQAKTSANEMILVAPPEELIPSLVGDATQYFPAVAINALIRILTEPRNSVHYQGTILAVMYICKSLGKRVAPHLDKIIPAFLYTLEKVNRSLRKFLFEQLAGLIRIVEEQIQPHLDHVAVITVVYAYWDDHMEEVLNLMKELANSIGERFRIYLPDVVPQILRVIKTERNNREGRPRTIAVLKTIVSLGRLLDGYLHLVIPALVTLIESNADLNARKQGLGSLGSLVKKLNVSVFASKIIHMLVRVIANHSELVYLAMDCLCCMVYTMGEDYAIFVPVVSQVLGRQVRNHDIFDRYDLLVSKILKYQPLPVASWATDPLKQQSTSSSKQDSEQEEVKSLPINQPALIKAWETSQRSTKDDWNEWMRAFSVELLRESPSPVLRACKELASVYQPLARELFNASFIAVWPQLSSPTQDNLIRALETAFQSPNLPSEILQTLLNLAEFMEHDDQSLPIDIRLLGSLAEKCHSFAKALHYKELEFNTNPSADAIQALISINSKLNQPEAARGILKYAQEHLSNVEVQASWHEKLLRWDDALTTHDKVLKEDPNNIDSIFGKMRCLFAMGEWRRLNDHVQETWSKIYGNTDGDDDDVADGVAAPPAPDPTAAPRPSMLGEGASLDVPPALKKELCSNAAKVAFFLHNWDAIPKYINADMDETEAYLFQAVVSIRRMELNDAMHFIYQCRQVMDPTLRSLVSESYSRAYMPSIVNLQTLAEMEEIVEYLRVTKRLHEDKLHATSSSVTLTATTMNLTSTTLHSMSGPRHNSSSNASSPGRVNDVSSFLASSLRNSASSSASSFYQDPSEMLSKLQNTWTRRMLGAERNIQVWQNLLLMRSLVLDPREDVDIWLKYARLCRKSGHLNLAASALWRVGAQPFIRSVQRDPFAPIPINLHGGVSGGGDSSMPDLRVAFSYLRHLWAEGREDVALRQITYFIDGLEQHAHDEDEEMRKLRVQAYIQLGEWQISLLEPRNHTDGLFEQVLVCLETATQLDPTNSKAWHEWALMNFRALDAATAAGASSTGESPDDLDAVNGSNGSNASNSLPGSPKDTVKEKGYAANAIHGFFRSISLGYLRYDVTKDVLRLLTLWFAHGQRTDVHEAMSAGFHDVSIDTWLDVIPQLIARIDSPYGQMNELLHELLSRIGLAHPQALIYPITVASKATNATRKQAAEGILAEVRRHSSRLVSEADMVSRELIRVAILWNELWYGALEEASKHFFNNRDVKAMIAELAPLHEQMATIGEEEPPTLREVAFHQAFARDLAHAKEWSNLYEQTHNIDDLNQAWDIYYNVFSRIRKQLANLSSLELANVGPKLLSVQNLCLAVPGTYKAGAPIVRIQSFDTKITVLTSKQRPRKVTIHGSDGKAYPFLLKGHEDLRQDERVMQLFGVINTLLANDNDTSKRNLSIERYSVLPLSHTSGLIGWVPNCDTLHQLIRDYREARKIQLNVEHRLMVQLAPDYDKLPLMQKVEAFRYALGETTGQDLYRVLWLKSQNSEVWLDRRRNYTRSLAVMSMAGYILGLGDRHPSNLMLDRVSGKIVHIDFGDCFEVAMERDKYPERIPFRLTRMLTQAMEVSGIEGNFRYTCEASMRVLRDNRDSLMAILEAFVYDPLINWRLLKKDAVPSHAQPREEEEEISDEPSRSVVRPSTAGGEGRPRHGTTDGEDEQDNDDEDGEKRGEHGRRDTAKEDPVTGETPSVGANGKTSRQRNSSSARMLGGFTLESLGADAGDGKLRYESGRKPTGPDGAHRAGRNGTGANGEVGGTGVDGAATNRGARPSIEESTSVNQMPQLNEKALSVIERVKKKLAGRDFDDGKKVLSVDAQVDRLIQQATSHENLCQLYYGWCPFW